MPWYRTIKPEDEINILTVRRRLKHDQQSNCPKDYTTHKELQGKVTDNFTRLSAFQYIKSGTKQRVFTSYDGEDNIGVILLRYNDTPRQVLWRDNNRTEVSDYILKQPLTREDFLHALKDNNFIQIDEGQVSIQVETSFNKLKGQYAKEKLDPKYAVLPWTEGLFRYKMEEIDGIVVNSKSALSCMQGYCFGKIVEANNKQVPCKFYSFDTEKSEFTEIPRDYIKEKISSSVAQTKVLYEQYQKCQTSIESSITK